MQIIPRAIFPTGLSPDASTHRASAAYSSAGVTVAVGSRMQHYSENSASASISSRYATVATFTAVGASSPCSRHKRPPSTIHRRMPGSSASSVPLRSFIFFENQFPDVIRRVWEARTVLVNKRDDERNQPNPRPEASPLLVDP